AAHTRRGSEPRNTSAVAAPPASLRKRRRVDALSSLISKLLRGENSWYCMQWYAAESRVAPFLAPLACYIQPPESIDAPRMPSPPAKPAERLRACGMEIARVGAELAARGWTPATSSNFSMRLDDSTVAVTI